MYTESQVRAIAANLSQFDPPRVERAIAIVVSGEIHQLPSGNYACRSHSAAQPAEYAVNPRYESCNCPDCAKSGNVCKHLLAWRLLQQLETAYPLRRFATLDDLIEWCTSSLTPEEI